MPISVIRLTLNSDKSNTSCANLTSGMPGASLLLASMQTYLPLISLFNLYPIPSFDTSNSLLASWSNWILLTSALPISCLA